MKIIIFLMFFLLLGGFFIISNENLKMNDKENIEFFFEEYENWLNGIFENSKSLSGYIIKMKWLPGE